MGKHKRKRKNGTRSNSFRILSFLGLVLGGVALFGSTWLSNEPSEPTYTGVPTETTGKFKDTPITSEAHPILEQAPFDSTALCLFWNETHADNGASYTYHSHWLDAQTGKLQDAQLPFPVLARGRTTGLPYEIGILYVPQDTARPYQQADSWLVFRHGTELQFILKASSAGGVVSPDGQLLAVNWSNHGPSGVLIADYYTGKVLRNYPMPLELSGYGRMSWSADQKYLLFDRSINFDGAKYHISFTLSVADGAYRTIVTPRTYLYDTWSPVGHLLVTSHQSAKETLLMFLNPEIGIVQQFSLSPNEIILWRNYQASWSPDGQWFVYPVTVHQARQNLSYMVALGINGKRAVLSLPNGNDISRGRWLANSTLTFSIGKSVNNSATPLTDLYAWHVPDPTAVAIPLLEDMGAQAGWNWTYRNDAPVFILSGIDPTSRTQVSWELDRQQDDLTPLPFIGLWNSWTADGKYLFRIVIDPNLDKTVAPDTPERAIIQRYSVADRQITEYEFEASTLWFDNALKISGFNPVLSPYGDWVPMKYRKRDMTPVAYDNNWGESVWFNVKTGGFKPKHGNMLAQSPSPLLVTQEISYSPFPTSGNYDTLWAERGQRYGDLQHIDVYTPEAEQLAFYSFRHECLLPLYFDCSTTIIPSADGQHLLYIEHRTDKSYRAHNAVRLLLVMPGNNRTTVIASNNNLGSETSPFASLQAQWSPDSRYFVVEYIPDYSQRTEHVWRLELYDAAGTLRSSQHGTNYHPTEIALQACGIPYLQQPEPKEY